ncbi:hypothetical protein AAY473_000029 [Plecturocebus cupreus]
MARSTRGHDLVEETLGAPQEVKEIELSYTAVEGDSPATWEHQGHQHFRQRDSREPHVNEGQVGEEVVHGGVESYRPFRFENQLLVRYGTGPFQLAVPTFFNPLVLWARDAHLPPACFQSLGAHVRGGLRGSDIMAASKDECLQLKPQWVLQCALSV